MSGGRPGLHGGFRADQLPDKQTGGCAWALAKENCGLEWPGYGTSAVLAWRRLLKAALVESGQGYARVRERFWRLTETYGARGTVAVGPLAARVGRSANRELRAASQAAAPSVAQLPTGGVGRCMRSYESIAQRQGATEVKPGACALVPQSVLGVVPNYPEGCEAS